VARRAKSLLSLDRDPSVRVLPWLIGAMVFLGTLALAGWMGVERATANWRLALADQLTVQIADGPDADREADAAARVMAATPGIGHVRMMSRQDVARLLEPWLGREGALALPLPRMVDVRLEPGVAIDTGALRARLLAVAPSARLDDHALWLERAASLARGLEALAAGAVLLVALATAAMVVFAVRAGLLVHREAIELMHLIGAQDGFVARQFQRLAVSLALRGAVPAFAVAALAIFLLGLAADALQAPLLPRIRFGPDAWAILALAPLGAVALAALAARRTVMRDLRRYV